MVAEAGPRAALREDEVLIERGGRLGTRLELEFDGMRGENDGGELGICWIGDPFNMLCKGCGSEIEMTGAS